MTKQISAADRIVVTKGDRVTPARSLPAFAEAAH
jgi:G3E family GTPase